LKHGKEIIGEKKKKTNEINSSFLQNRWHHSCYKHSRQRGPNNWNQALAIMRNFGGPWKNNFDGLG
jgi:hypothetical protein